jgi:hypothetical protein
MALLKKGLTLSMIGITILVLAFSFWNDKRLESLANNDDWSSSYTFQYDQNNEVVLDHNDYNYIEQGEGVVEAVLSPILYIYNFAGDVTELWSKFIGSSTEAQTNDLEYKELKDLYLSWGTPNNSRYRYEIDNDTDIVYYSITNGYFIHEYTTLFGIRLWYTSTKLTYQELYDLDQQYQLGL